MIRIINAGGHHGLQDVRDERSVMASSLNRGSDHADRCGHGLGSDDVGKVAPGRPGDIGVRWPQNDLFRGVGRDHGLSWDRFLFKNDLSCGRLRWSYN